MFYFLLSTIIGSIVGVMIGRRMHRSFYNDGYRDAVRDSVSMVSERGRVAVELSPRGQLAWGLVRAQTCHTIEMELRAMLAGRK
jgi:hypothetical protein